MIAWDMDDIKTLSNCEEKVQHSSKNVANELNPSLGIIANKRAAEGYDEPQHTPLVLQVVRGEGSSSTCYPKISLDKRIIDCNQRNLDLVNNIKSSCRQIRSEVDESGKGSSPLCITPEVVRSVGAQLELLHHELFLTKKKVKERNRQILKLERIINNQNEELQHNCEGSSNLIKLTELLFGAVDMQNKQLENMRNIKRRLLSLEDSPFVSHKPINIQKSKKYSSPNLMQVPEQGNPRIINQCDHICNFECKTGNKTTLIGYSRPKLMCAEEKKKEELKSPDYSSEISHGCEGKNHSIENRDELEKQRMINCQLNEHLMKLQEEIKTLKLKIEKLEEQEVAACKHSSLSEKEKQTLLEQLSNLTRQNSKLHGHVSQIDRERDKAVRELDSSDEIISNMGIEVQRANFEARNFECQLSVSAVRCRKLEDLLENSEKIAASLKKQKNQLEKEIDIARRETDVIRKSFQSLRMKYKKSSNICQIYKKKLWETNEEKAVLQSQIQEYVGRVRHIEEMLLQKEQEREFVFQQFQELSAKDNCGDNFLEMIDNREDPSRDGTPNSFADTIFVANAETQTAALRKDGAGERCSYESTDFVEGMAHQTKSSSKEYIAFESTLPEPSKATSKDGLPTNQLDVVGKTFSRLESQMKMIGQSFDRCQTNCISREGRASRQYIADSSLSTML